MATLNPTLTVKEPRPGMGGRGPAPPPPTGGGGGGGQGPSDFGDRLRRYKLGMLVAMTPIAMMFIAFTSAYIVRQGMPTWNPSTGGYESDWRALNLPLTLLWLNTLVLAGSSLTLELARRSLERRVAAWKAGLVLEGAGTRNMPWLALTVALGVAFLAGQVAAWRALAGAGVFFASNPSSSFFYVLTGAHGLHLAGGIVALLYAAGSSLLGRPLETRRLVVSVTAWYWHFMGVLWIYIFALLYFAR